MKFDGRSKVRWSRKSLMVIPKTEGHDHAKVRWNVADTSADRDVRWGWNNNFSGVMSWRLRMLLRIGNSNSTRTSRQSTNTFLTMEGKIETILSYSGAVILHLKWSVKNKIKHKTSVIIHVLFGCPFIIYFYLIWNPQTTSEWNK